MVELVRLRKLKDRCSAPIVIQDSRGHFVTVSSSVIRIESVSFNRNSSLMHTVFFRAGYVGK